MQAVDATAGVDPQLAFRPVLLAQQPLPQRLGVVGIGERPSCSNTPPTGIALPPPLSPIVAALCSGLSSAARRPASFSISSCVRRASRIAGCGWGAAVATCA